MTRVRIASVILGVCLMLPCACAAVHRTDDGPRGPQAKSDGSRSDSQPRSRRDDAARKSDPATTTTASTHGANHAGTGASAGTSTTAGTGVSTSSHNDGYVLTPGMTRPLAAVITAVGERGELTPSARELIERAAGNRIATRVYLSSAIDPTKTFTFDESSVRNHIARRAPSRQAGCLFIVDLEGDYYQALRRGDDGTVQKTIALYEQAVDAAKRARPDEPVMVYGIPNRNWSSFDLKLFDPVFAKVDYINASAYAGRDGTMEQYRRRIDENFAISKQVAERHNLELVAHVNPRFADQTLIPLDQFIEMMRYVKAQGVNHVVYWQPPWRRIGDFAADGKPEVLSDDAWKAAVEECYLCALLKVFDPENPVSKTCRTVLPASAERVERSNAARTIGPKAGRVPRAPREPRPQQPQPRSTAPRDGK